MKTLLVAACATFCCVSVYADTPPPRPTQQAQPSKNPEDARTSTTGEADKNTYQEGKKRDAAAGCSTPTDAKDAGVDTSRDSDAKKRSNGNRTVCTTSGAEGVGATDKSKSKPEQKSSPPRSSESAQPK